MFTIARKTPPPKAPTQKLLGTLWGNSFHDWSKSGCKQQPDKNEEQTKLLAIPPTTMNDSNDDLQQNPGGPPGIADRFSDEPLHHRRRLHHRSSLVKTPPNSYRVSRFGHYQGPRPESPRPQRPHLHQGVTSPEGMSQIQDPNL